jgi:hypothetical protein
MRRLLFIASIAATMAACASTPQQPAKPVATEPPAKPVVQKAAAPVARSAADLTDHTGDSPETAVAVPADAPNEGIDFQNQWIFNRYGRFMRLKWGIAHTGPEGSQQFYKIITVKLADESQRKVYFDITEQWKNWKPEETAPQPPPH